MSTMISMTLTAMGALLAVATLPLVLELLTLTAAFLLLRRRRQLYPGSAPAPRLTVVVPAHNEQGLVGGCVASLLASAAGWAKVMVIAHNCSDATAKNAALAGADVRVYDDPAMRGKGHALRYGFAKAIEEGAEAVLVVDADSTVSAGLISAVLRHLQDGEAAVQCRYEMLSATTKTKSRLTSLAFRAFTYIRPMGRERLGFSAGILGNGFALTADLLQRVPYEAFSVVEDLEYHIHLLLAGERVRFIGEAIVSSDGPSSAAGESVQQSRWQGGRLRVARVWLPRLFRQLLRGRLRLLEPMLDLAGLPMAFGVAALVAACFVPILWVRIYALTSLAVAVIHVLTAAFAGPDVAGTLRALAMAPFYILWKFRLVPGLLRASGAQATWVRTERRTSL
ncbi:glycosyltransferase family 2 protein [Paracidobacterium acidisoli]|uniref:Glycosyltransferase n=1 Tax=Paracidobacterium acidisoli TaxID=2303751 RepID=A0A372ISA0_9BACT|nr:glycosyltransferase family 2 protein [Paracidobacterium acidisoli]MBT9330256.1 glycosyltransferase family 2 protein [Paracidobacterium acidisoli]